MMLNLKKGEWILVVFNFLVLMFTSVYYSNIKNYEFIIYIFVVVFFMALVLLTIRKTEFGYPILFGLNLWALLHLFGGIIHIGDGVLYGVQLIPIISNGDFTILRYDQALHFFGFMMTAFVAYHILKPHLIKTANMKLIYPLVVLISMGAGALNEVVEFLAVLALPKTGVGGYYNTGLDLVSNMLGAIFAVFVIYAKEKWKKK